MRRLLRIFAVITSFGAYLMMLMGALVTKTGSGQGCGNSWPFCHGQLIPDTISVQGVFEYTHRIVSGMDGFLILVLTVASWLMYRKDLRVRLFGLMSLFFVVVQGALGALTVVFEGTFAKNWLLALHFGFSLISFASVVLLTIHLFQIERVRRYGLQKTAPVARVLQYGIWGLTLYTYLVVYSGALVRHAEATMGCGYQVPGCGSTYFPNLASPAGIQMLHRYAASSLWFLVLAFLILVLRNSQGRRDIVFGAWSAFILITLQAVAGMSIVLTGGQLLVELVHSTIISGFFAVACYLCMQCGWPGKRKVVEQNVEREQLELHPVS